MQSICKLEEEYAAYVEKHKMRELFTKLMSKCFEKNVQDPENFLLSYLSKSANKSTKNSAAKEICVFENDMKKLNEECTNLKLKIAHLEQQLSDERERADENEPKLKKLKLIADVPKIIKMKRIQSSSSDEIYSQPIKQRLEKRKKPKRKFETKTMPKSSGSEESITGLPQPRPNQVNVNIKSNLELPQPAIKVYFTKREFFVRNRKDTNNFDQDFSLQHF